MKKLSTFLICILLLTATLSYGQAGSLDSTFNDEGYIVTAFDGPLARGRSVAIQIDGKFVVAGEYQKSSGFHDFALVRYSKDGFHDNSFGINGIVKTDLGSDDISYAVVIQPDGKIVVAGTSNTGVGIYQFALVRYTTSGFLDNSFGTNGLVLGPFGDGRSVTLQPDGKILVAGTTTLGSPDKFLVARYKTDGTPDNTFGTNGFVTTEIRNGPAQANSIAIQSDGKIIVAGTSAPGSLSDFAIVRYNHNGTLDDTFDEDGIVTTDLGGGKKDFGEFVVIQPDKKIVVAGKNLLSNTVGRFAVVRYTPDGSLDISFGVNGIVKTLIGDGKSFPSGRSVALQSDGKLVVTGNENDNFVLVRYNEDGSLDNTFDSDGIVSSDITDFATGYSCVIQQDGKIVVAGTAFCGACDANGFAVARYISGSNLGIISFSKQDHGLLIYPNPLKENAMIEYTLTNAETISIDLYDISGRIVQSFVREEKRVKGQHTETLNLETSIPSGAYILTLSNGEGISSIRVVK